MWGIVISSLAFIAILIVLFLIQFYRNPNRTPPQGDNIVSPADGKIIKIIRTSQAQLTIDKGFVGKIKTWTKDVSKECYLVSIFMSPIDVHYNRSPIAGTIKKINHVAGKLLPVNTLDNGLQNEHNEILIQGKGIKVKAIQVAGLVARRIVCDVKEGQQVKKGQLIGMIRLGSQANLIVPSTVNIVVKEGQYVKAGETIIAELP